MQIYQINLSDFIILSTDVILDVLLNKLHFLNMLLGLSLEAAASVATHDVQILNFET